MVNKAYRKGYEKERKIVNEARGKGHLSFRSAGSHSPIDVVIIDRELSQITFIQAKSDNYTEAAKKKLEKEYEWLDDMFYCVFEVQ